MDADALTDAVRADNDTALSRLGSSKSIYALTAGEMDDDAVLAAAADLADGAAGTFADWDGPVVAQAAETAREHRDAVASEGGEPTGDDPHGLFEALADCEDDAERLGGLVAWTVVLETVTDQLTGYFVGQADPGTAGTFRGLGDDYAAVRAAAVEALADGDVDAAKAAADDVVGAAYDDYVETLEDLGVNPKPVC